MIAKITWVLIHDCKFNEKIVNIFEVKIFNTICNRFLQVDELNATDRFLYLHFTGRGRDFSQKSSNLNASEAKRDKSQMCIRRLLGWRV